MNCNAVKNILDLYGEGRLTARRLAGVKSHLEACPDCAREAMAFARLRAPQKIAAPAALKAKLLKILGTAKAPEPELSFEGLPSLAGAAAYAALILALNLAGPGVPSQAMGGSVKAGDYR